MWESCPIICTYSYVSRKCKIYPFCFYLLFTLFSSSNTWLHSSVLSWQNIFVRGGRWPPLLLVDGPERANGVNPRWQPPSQLKYIYPGIMSGPRLLIQSVVFVLARHIFFFLFLVTKCGSGMTLATISYLKWGSSSQETFTDWSHCGYHFIYAIWVVLKKNIFITLLKDGKANFI